MRRKLALGLAVALAASLFIGVSLPGTASAEPIRPTSMAPGAFIATFPIQDLLTLSVALFDAPSPGPFVQRLGGRTVTFTAGGKLLCTATSSVVGEVQPVSDFGIAKCRFNLFSPGGLTAWLTGRALATFAGDDVYKPSTVVVPAFGPPAPKHVTF
jgi:hypothetical protein